MMTYKDMTFCSFHKDCKQIVKDKKGGEQKCDRALTEAVKEAAQKWWDPSGKNDAPICEFSEKPECWEEKDECVKLKK